MVHRYNWAGEGIDWGGSFSQSAIARNETAWIVVPADWGWLLKERWDGWRGLGLYEADGTLYQGLGYVSSNYSIFTAWNYGTIDGGAFWLGTVMIYHNG
jgi:hypothetical protein